MFVFELLVLFGLPLLFACGTTYMTWNALSRPVVFLIVAVIVLYLVYAASMWLLAVGPVGYTLSIRTPGEVPVSEPLFLLLPPYKIPLVVFAGASIPVLAVLLRAFRKERVNEV
jgi:hypothetical protein